MSGNTRGTSLAFSTFPPHVHLETFVVPGKADSGDSGVNADENDGDVVVECRSYETTCWATAGGDTAKEACGKLIAFAHAIGLDPPVPSVTRLATANEHRADVDENNCRPVRVFARVDLSSPLTIYATRLNVAFANVVGVFFEPRGVAFAMPFEGKLVGDEEVRRRARVFRRALARSRVAGVRDRDVLFASYDASTDEKFVRRNEMLMYL